MKRCLLIMCEVLLYAFALLTILVTVETIFISPEDAWNLGFMTIYVGKAPAWTHWVTTLSLWGLLILLWRDVPKHLWSLIQEGLVWAFLLFLSIIDRSDIEDEESRW